MLFAATSQMAKSAIRTIVGTQMYACTLPLFTDLKLLNITEIAI